MSNCECWARLFYYIYPAEGMEIVCCLSVRVFVYLLGSEHHGHHTLWLGGLGALINQDGAELHLGQARVTGPDTGTTDNISILQKQGGGLFTILRQKREPGYNGKTEVVMH